MTALVDHVRYNNLTSLEEANISRQVCPAPVDDIINGPIRDVLLKHGAHIALCLYLQHRHLTVGADEAVKDIVSFGNKVVPTIWMVSGGKVLPMELAVFPSATATAGPTPAFLLDFLSVLASNGCDGLFCIDTLAKSPWSEMKIGDASVVVPSNDSDAYNQDKFIHVAFAFDEEKPKFKVHGRCGTDHKHTSRPVKPSK